MNKKEANKLISTYYAGETTWQEEEQLRTFFSSKNVPDEFQKHADQFRYYDEVRNVEHYQCDPFAKIDFEKDAAVPPFEGGVSGMAEKESKFDEAETTIATAENIRSRVMFDPLNNKPGNKLTWLLRIAAGFLLLLAGFAAGQFLETEDYASTQQVAQLEQEVQQMKRALMNTGRHQQASAGERLSAVNLSTRIAAGDETSDQQVTDILIHTMNTDENVNVRSAAAEALFQFRKEVGIKVAFINGLSKQDDPLMQITLIDMLVELEATNAISEMEKMLANNDTNELVRRELEAGIAELNV